MYCSVCSVRCAVFCVLCALCSVQCMKGCWWDGMSRITKESSLGFLYSLTTIVLIIAIAIITVIITDIIIVAFSAFSIIISSKGSSTDWNWGPASQVPQLPWMNFQKKQVGWGTWLGPCPFSHKCHQWWIINHDHHCNSRWIFTAIIIMMMMIIVHVSIFSDCEQLINQDS